MCRILALYLGDEILVGKSLFAFVPAHNPPHSGNIPSSFNLTSADKSFKPDRPEIPPVSITDSPTHWSPGDLHCPQGPSWQQEQPTSSQARRGLLPPGPALPVIWPLAPLLSTPNNTPVPWLQASGHTTIQASLCFLLAFLPLSVQWGLHPFLFPPFMVTLSPTNSTALFQDLSLDLIHRPQDGFYAPQSTDQNPTFSLHNFPILTSRHWSSLYASTCSFPLSHILPFAHALLSTCVPSLQESCASHKDR